MAELSANDFERLSAYLDGELPDEERMALEAELESNNTLRAELASIEQTIRLIQALPELQVPRDFTLTREMLQEPDSTPANMVAMPKQSRTNIWLATAAMFVVVIAGALLFTSAMGDAEGTRNQPVDLLQDAATVAQIASAPTVVQDGSAGAGDSELSVSRNENNADTNDSDDPAASETTSSDGRTQTEVVGEDAPNPEVLGADSDAERIDPIAATAPATPVLSNQPVTDSVEEDTVPLAAGVVATSEAPPADMAFAPAAPPEESPDLQALFNDNPEALETFGNYYLAPAATIVNAVGDVDNVDRQVLADDEQQTNEQEEPAPAQMAESNGQRQRELSSLQTIGLVTGGIAIIAVWLVR